MNNYIYILPHKVENVNNTNGRIKIITQKSSLIMGKSNSLDIVKEILENADRTKVEDLFERLQYRLSKTNLQKMIYFLRDNNLIYLSKDVLSEGDINFLYFLSQYTISLDKYLKKMKNMQFRLIAEGDNLAFVKEILEGFGLNNSLLQEEQLNELDNRNIILSCFDSTTLDKLENLAEKIERNKGLLWTFVLFYDDSFLLSPILNQFNYTDFYSFSKQVDLEHLREKGIAKNILVQRMGICEMILNVLTSIMKLNIQTTYDKTIIYDSLDKTLLFEKIYCFPKDFNGMELNVQRWDGEV